MLKLIAAFALLMSLHGMALADSWLPPKAESTLSGNGQYRFTVTPRNIESQSAYFEAKAAGKDLPASAPARGLLEHFDGKGWKTVWGSVLVNEVAPVSTLISDDGKRVITFDNWHSLGFGKNVVVIYGSNGELIRSLDLVDLMPSYFLDGLPRSVSSMQWHGAEPRLQGGELELPISNPDNDRKRPAFVVSVSLDDGAVQPVPTETMNSVKTSFCAAHSRSVQSDNASNAFNRTDLVAPVVRSGDAWTRYQYQAVFRLMPSDQSEMFDGTDSTFELLLPGEYMAKEFRDTFRAALTADKSELSLRWFTSRDLELMTIEVERTARRIKPGQLAGVDMRFLTDDAHSPRLQAALSPSGATLTFIDINTPIPQRPEVLARLPADRTIDPDCRQ